jgi:hypothetical protein
MLTALQILSVMLVVIALTPALAHALESPGKRRLAEDTYLAVQAIYYPGFTIAGFAEPLALLASIVLLVLTPAGTPPFWLTLVAALSLAAMHAVYWLVTHPVNKTWLKKEKLNRAGSRFFSTGSSANGATGANGSRDWTHLRDRWEYSHLVRAVLAVAAFAALLFALARSG